MYKCCIFDLDGTLVNSIYAIQKSVNDTLSYWNMREISVEESRLYVGDGYKKLLERSLIACGDKELTHYEEAVERYQDIFRECCMYRVEAYEGIGELIPAAGFIWSLGRIWGDRKEITNLQTVLYCLCLGAMASDALSTGAVWDALILEAVNLAVFLLAHMRKCMRWIRISGIIMILVALYMTKDFWLSLSWWVYLLAAGLGLIVFAAVNEMKKR